MKTISEEVVERLETGRSSVLATVIYQGGPSPRGPGTKCLVRENGTFSGSVGGGFLEVKVLETARNIFSTGVPERLYFSLKGRDVAETDMLCGGEVDVFLEPISPEDPDQLAVFRETARIQQAGGAGILASVVDPERWRPGNSKAFISRTGESIGALPGTHEPLEQALQHDMEMLLNRGTPELRVMPDGLELFVEPVVSSPVLYIFGAGHVSREIAPLASRVGFHVVVVDDREDFADPDYFPTAQEVCCIPFEGSLERFPIGRDDFLVIVTRGHLHDKTVLAQALETDARYLGMIGSTRKRDIIYQKLKDEGFTDEHLSRVHCPIGLEIGADTPSEIAVSIVAELIQAKSESGSIP